MAFTEQDPLLPSIDNDHSQRSKLAPAGPLEISRSTRYAILAGLWLATLLSSLNTTLVATLIPSISSEFKKSNEASWLGTSYLLAVCTFTPLYGRLCDLLGRRRANQLAVCTTALGTISCAFSRDMKTLVAARFLAGMGGGGVFTTSSVIASDMYDMRSRGLVQGVSNLFTGLGMGLGGPLGGLISDLFGWRWAFIMQMPVFVLSLMLTEYNLRYVTPGVGSSAKEVLKRIDWAGCLTLLISIGSFLAFLGVKFNDDLPWTNSLVIATLTLTAVFMVAFILVELLVAAEPILAPVLLRQKVPVIVGTSNFFVSVCTFSIIYFFPMWFQTVALTSASEAGLHLLPNSVAMSSGSLFAGYLMHRTGKYKMINLVFGLFPFIGSLLITFIHENSGPWQSWLSIIPLGFGNAVVLQTMLIALLAHLPDNLMAVGTGFGQLFRGLGQVIAVAVSSAIFQFKLDVELRKRIDRPDAAEIIHNIRHSATLVARLPPDLQQAARDSHAVALRAVFVFAACSTLIAYIVRLPVPEKSLDHKPKKDLINNQNDISHTNGSRAHNEGENRAPMPAATLSNPVTPRQRLSCMQSPSQSS